MQQKPTPKPRWQAPFDGTDFLIFMGLLLVGAGVALMHIPSALIVVGVVITGIGLWGAWGASR